MTAPVSANYLGAHRLGGPDEWTVSRCARLCAGLGTGRQLYSYIIRLAHDTGKSVVQELSAGRYLQLLLHSFLVRGVGEPQGYGVLRYLSAIAGEQQGLEVELVTFYETQ